MSQFIIKGGLGRLFRYDLQEGTTTIGREADNTLVLPNSSVSRTHARLIRTGDQVNIEDAGSSHGLFVNGEKMPEAFLVAGDVVEIGQFTLIRIDEDQTQFEGRYVEYLDAYTPSATAAKAKTMNIEQWERTDQFRINGTIRVQSVGDPTRYWDLGNTPVSIGRGGVIEVGGLMSGGIIAEVQKDITGDGAMVTRKKRLATIKHNGKSVKEAVVTMGDALTFGDSQFVLIRSN
jgi:hypothetical protein